MNVEKNKKGVAYLIVSDVTAKMAAIILPSNFGLDSMTESMDLLISINEINGSSCDDGKDNELTPVRACLNLS